MPKLTAIVAGVDFSQKSHEVVSWAARHLAPDAEFVLVHAMELPVPPSFLGESADQHVIAEEMRKGFEEDLNALATQIGGARFKQEIPLGSASTALSDVAESVGADLILVGPHGDRGGMDALLGGTAERILTTSTVPVLLAAGDLSDTPKRILVALDESESRRRILSWASFLADRFSATVRACHCLDSRLFGRIRLVSSPGRVEELVHEAQRGARVWVQTQLEDAGLPAEPHHVEVTVGAPAHGIHELTNDDCDMLIIGARQEGAAKRLFLGRVARKIIQNARVPVLVVPEPTAKDAVRVRS